MRAKTKVNKNVTNNVTYWEGALRDAERGLGAAQRAVASWKAAIRTCRERIAAGAPWPGTQSVNHLQEQQHSE